MIITRDDVLEAIEKEPLIAGNWVEQRSMAFDTPCAVCAVGAVMRGQGLTDDEIAQAAMTATQGMFNPSDGSLPWLLEQGLYMSALSIFWERMIDKVKPSEWFTFKANDLEKFKPRLRVWVLENLPDGVLYDSENAKEFDYVGYWKAKLAEGVA